MIEMTQADLDEIKARCDAANQPYPVIHKEIDALPWVEAQLDLKRHAIKDVPRLLAEVERLKAKVVEGEKRAEAERVDASRARTAYGEEHAERMRGIDIW